MCSPIGVRVLLSTKALRKWGLTKIDVKDAFLQTGRACPEVYVTPPRESSDCGNVGWLLLSAAYGLVNANDKFQVQSDKLITDLRFVPAPLILQLFLLRRNGALTVVLAKIVDDILLAGPSSVTVPIVAAFND